MQYDEGFSINLKVTTAQVANLLTSAFEGGSNYWYRITKEVQPKVLIYREFRDETGELAKYATEFCLNPEGALYISDEASGVERELKEPVKLDLETIRRGLVAFSQDKEMRHHFADFIKGNDDAETGDVFLQECIFSKVIYG